MINFSLILVGGISAFAWKQISNKRKQRSTLTDKCLPEQNSNLIHVNNGNIKEYDDVKEIRHNYKSSLYAIALVSAGSLFFRPIILLGLPVVGYSLAGFLNALKHSPKKEIRSPFVIFEILGVFATLFTQHFFYLSLLLALGLLRRGVLLKTGGLVNYYSSRDFNASTSVWVIREQVELEVLVKELQEGDIVVGRAGETILTEGEVIKGKALIKQFSLQRRMKDIEKNVGDEVYPFTAIISGVIHIRVS